MGHTDLMVDCTAELALRVALKEARSSLLDRRTVEGAWVSQAPNSALAAAHYLLALCWLDRQHTHPGVSETRAWLRAQERPTGGWARCAGGAFDLDATAMAYLALRVLGDDRTDPALDRAWRAIDQCGGLQDCEPVTCYFLAAFGQLEYQRCLPLPPEALLLPRWAPGNLWGLADWSLALFVPLSILWAQQPSKVLPQGPEMGPLWRSTASKPVRAATAVGGPGPSRAGRPRGSTRHLLARAVFASAAGLAGLRIPPLRGAALAVAEQWLQDQLCARTGLQGSSEATALAMMALLSRGYPRGSGALHAAGDALEQFRALQPAGAIGAVLPPTVNDTAASLRALAPKAEEADLAAVTPPTRPGLEWLLRQENTLVAASRRERAPTPGGWSRRAAGGVGPGPGSETVATAGALLALRRQFAENPPSSLVTDDSMMAMIRANSLNLAHRQIAVLDRVAAASRRARHWLISMQNPDGGWGYTARHTPWPAPLTRRLSRSLPRCDLSTPFATGVVLQALGAWELGCGQSTVDRGVAFLRSAQQEHGAWTETHDAGPLATAWAAIEGLRAVGLARRDETIRRAADWLLQQQMDDGGWRERCPHAAVLAAHQHASDRDGLPAASSCPFATARALLALFAAGERGHTGIALAVDFLLRCQSPQGHWTASADASTQERRNPCATAPTLAGVTAEVLQALVSYARPRHGMR